MIAISGHFRYAIAGVQVIGTLAAMGLGGVTAALNQQRQDVGQAQAALTAADRAFHRGLRAALDDGTPSRMLEPLARVEWQDWSTAEARSFIIDRLVISDLNERTNQIQALTSTVVETQRAVELDLAGKIGTALYDLDQDVAAAHAAGVAAVGDYDSRRTQMSPWGTVLVSPSDARARIVMIAGLDTEVRDATAAKIAADQAAAAAAAAALRAATDNAAYQHDRAHADLARASAIAVLRVADIVAAVAAVDARLPQAHSIDELNSAANDYAVQARQVENILYIRSNTYNQLARARSRAARTASLGVDVSSYVARLNAAQSSLDVAPDINSILAVADAIRDVTTGLDAAYANALAHPPPPPGSVVLNVPFYAQIYSLSCEEAALQMVLAFEGIQTSQDAILNTIGVDRRPPQVDGFGNVIHWGDPYANFVGDPNGYREGALYGSRSGYGTYFSAIARAATSMGGTVLQSGEGVNPQVLYDMIGNHHPAVVWVAWEYSPHGVTTYQAWDGRVVMYGAPWEHAVALIGTSPASVLVNNPHGGQQWVSKATFERAYQMFNQMAVIVR